MVTTRPPKTIVKPTALGPVANTDTKLLIYGLFQKGRVLAQDGDKEPPMPRKSKKPVRKQTHSPTGKVVGQVGQILVTAPRSPLLPSMTVLEQLARIEIDDKGRRSLERRLKHSKIGRFKPFVDFDWNWPKKVDRGAIESAMTLHFLREGRNFIMLGSNGLGKTMILKNIAHQAVLEGHSVLVRSASDMLDELNSDSHELLRRRLKNYFVSLVAGAYSAWAVGGLLLLTGRGRQSDEIYYFLVFVVSIQAGVGTYRFLERASGVIAKLAQPRLALFAQPRKLTAAALGLWLPLTLGWWWNPLIMDAHWPAAFQREPARRPPRAPEPSASRSSREHDEVHTPPSFESGRGPGAVW